MPIPGQKDLWEIRFQRGIVGETDVQIEYQGQTARDQGKEAILPPTFESARQVVQFVSVRGSGRIELDAGTLPRGWQHENVFLKIDPERLAQYMAAHGGEHHALHDARGNAFAFR